MSHNGTNMEEILAIFAQRMFWGHVDTFEVEGEGSLASTVQRAKMTSEGLEIFTMFSF